MFAQHSEYTSTICAIIFAASCGDPTGTTFSLYSSTRDDWSCWKDSLDVVHSTRTTPVKGDCIHKRMGCTQNGRLSLQMYTVKEQGDKKVDSSRKNS